MAENAQDRVIQPSPDGHYLAMSPVKIKACDVWLLENF
jgi:hypothetical protein